MAAALRLINIPNDWYSAAKKRIVVERDTLPEISIVENALAIPGRDALYTVDGSRIDTTKRVNLPFELVSEGVIARVKLSDRVWEPEATVVPNKFEIIEEPVLFLGAIWPHYGHFLTDSMARLWALDEFDRHMPVVFINNHCDDFLKYDYINTIFDALQLTSRRILDCKTPYLFKRIFVPTASIQHSYRIFDCHQRAHLKVASVNARLESGGIAEKVYLSRSALRDKDRKSADEGRLEETLRADGFEIMYPEKLSMSQQISIFNSSKWIVGTLGSAFHTSLFSLKNYHGNIVMLSWNKINGRYLMIDEIKNYNSFYIGCMTIDNIDERSRIQNTTIDVDRALDAMKDIGCFL